MIGIVIVTALEIELAHNRQCVDIGKIRGKHGKLKQVYRADEGVVEIALAAIKLEETVKVLYILVGHIITFARGQSEARVAQFKLIEILRVKLREHHAPLHGRNRRQREDK